MSILLTDDEAIHDLNLRYRGCDKPTDVLSFAQNDGGRQTKDGGAPEYRIPNTELRPPDPKSGIPNPKSNLLLGDIVISVETAARQADIHGVGLDEELALLVTHGALHLLGYEDETENGMLEMEAKERALGVRP